MKFITLLFAHLLFTFSACYAQNDPQCGTKGLSSSSPPSSSPLLENQENKIVGGVEAAPHSFPWLASFGSYNPNEGPNEVAYRSSCTGSLIHPQFVLTAGHCELVMRDPQRMVVVAVHNVSSSQAEEPQKIYAPIAQFILHPLYRKLPDKTSINDIALIKLRSPVDTANNPLLGTVCFPDKTEDTQHDVHVGQVATACGWGRTVENSYWSGSRALMRVDLPVVSMDYCTRQYGLTEGTEGMMCTYSDQGKDACQGDSGGPLQLKVNGRWTVIGVTSFGAGCGQFESPGVWTKTAHYVGWIRETISREGGGGGSGF